MVATHENLQDRQPSTNEIPPFRRRIQVTIHQSTYRPSFSNFSLSAEKGGFAALAFS